MLKKILCAFQSKQNSDENMMAVCFYSNFQQALDGLSWAANPEDFFLHSEFMSFGHWIMITIQRDNPQSLIFPLKSLFSPPWEVMIHEPDLEHLVFVIFPPHLISSFACMASWQLLHQNYVKRSETHLFMFKGTWVLFFFNCNKNEQGDRGTNITGEGLVFWKHFSVLL